MEYYDCRAAIAAVFCAVPSLGDIRAGDFSTRIQALRTAAVVYVCPDEQDGLSYELTAIRSAVGFGLILEHSQTVAGQVNDLTRLELRGGVAHA
jgi:hypothetical protein